MTPVVYITIPLEGRISIYAYCEDGELSRLVDDIRNRPVAREIVLDAIEGEQMRAP